MEGVEFEFEVGRGGPRGPKHAELVGILCSEVHLDDFMVFAPAGVEFGREEFLEDEALG